MIPFELLHNSKSDFRNLHRLFSIAYVKHFRDGSIHRKEGLSQSIKAILVGSDPKSDGKLVYVPHTKSIIGSADYDLDPSHLSGLVFGLTYDGGINSISIYLIPRMEISNFQSRRKGPTIQQSTSKNRKQR